MLDAAHQQVGRTLIVLVWDNAAIHRDVAMREPPRWNSSTPSARRVFCAMQGLCRCVCEVLNGIDAMGLRLPPHATSGYKS